MRIIRTKEFILIDRDSIFPRNDLLLQLVKRFGFARGSGRWVYLHKRFVKLFNL